LGQLTHGRDQAHLGKLTGTTYSCSVHDNIDYVGHCSLSKVIFNLYDVLEVIPTIITSLRIKNNKNMSQYNMWALVNMVMNFWVP
jgi:hypothetical protein